MFLTVGCFPKASSVCFFYFYLILESWKDGIQINNLPNMFAYGGQSIISIFRMILEW